jgi:predicted O-linked N-acetylglucosamine transferase (SPINDLY family)
MWEPQKRQRFQQLRERCDRLDAAEKAELAALTQELEAAEAAYLNGAAQRLRQERKRIERQNRSLETLAARRRDLICRLECVLAEARSERNAIDSELALVLAGSNGSGAEQ